MEHGVLERKSDQGTWDGFFVKKKTRDKQFNAVPGIEQDYRTDPWPVPLVVDVLDTLVQWKKVFLTLDLRTLSYSISQLMMGTEIIKDNANMPSDFGDCWDRFKAQHPSATFTQPRFRKYLHPLTSACQTLQIT